MWIVSLGLVNVNCNYFIWLAFALALKSADEPLATAIKFFLFIRYFKISVSTAQLSHKRLDNVRFGVQKYSFKPRERQLFAVCSLCVPKIWNNTCLDVKQANGAFQQICRSVSPNQTLASGGLSNCYCVGPTSCVACHHASAVERLAVRNKSCVRPTRKPLHVVLHRPKKQLRHVSLRFSHPAVLASSHLPSNAAAIVAAAYLCGSVAHSWPSSAAC